MSGGFDVTSAASLEVRPSRYGGRMGRCASCKMGARRTAPGPVGRVEQESTKAASA